MRTARWGGKVGKAAAELRRHPDAPAPAPVADTEWSSRRKNLAVGIANKRYCDCSSRTGSHLAFRVARPMSWVACRESRSSLSTGVEEAGEPLTEMKRLLQRRGDVEEVVHIR
eukprot:jgi/Tetstr1/433972/TSEL_023149.t1